MDARGNIYRAPEDEIPAEDKERFDAAVLRGEAEHASDRIAAQIREEQADVNATRGAAIRRGAKGLSVFAGAAMPEGELVGDEDGLTDAERVVSEHLVAAVNAFGQLDRRHPDELREFVDGIHACQHQLGWRIVQRAYPKAWPVKRDE